MELKARESAPREEGSIIVRFAASLVADGGWHRAGLEREIEAAAITHLGETAPHMMLQYATATVVDDAGGDVVEAGAATHSAELGLELKFDADFHDPAEHDKIAELGIAAALQGWVGTALAELNEHERGLKGIVDALRAAVGGAQGDLEALLRPNHTATIVAAAEAFMAAQGGDTGDFDFASSSAAGGPASAVEHGWFDVVGEGWRAAAAGRTTSTTSSAMSYLDPEDPELVVVADMGDSHACDSGIHNSGIPDADGAATSRNRSPPPPLAAEGTAAPLPTEDTDTGTGACAKILVCVFNPMHLVKEDASAAAVDKDEGVINGLLSKGVVDHLKLEQHPKPDPAALAGGSYRI